MVELTATFNYERFRFENPSGDVIIGDAHDGKKPIAIKGPADLDELQPNHTYNFYGRWTEYENRRTGQVEKQFQFTTFVESRPASRAGIITYLVNSGKGLGIGHARAAKLYEKFGDRTLQICKESPDVAVASVKGWLLTEAELLAEELKKKESLESCTVELMELLNNKRFPKTLAKQAIKIWGNEAAEKIKQNPYLLLDFHGVGFRKADAFYISLGHNPKRLKRQTLCGWYALESDSSGDTWKPIQFAVDAIRGQVGSNCDPVRAIKLGKRFGMVSRKRHGAISIIRESGGSIVESGPNVFCAVRDHARQEELIAKHLAEKMAEDDFRHWPPVEEIEDIDDHQATTLEKALGGSVAILGGSPGTGKTFTAAALIKRVIERVGSENVAVAAPTGKAAVRITESLAAYGLNIHARTWYSLLGIDFTEGGSPAFLHNETNPWPYKLIVGDESSMVDTFLFSSIVRAIPHGCGLLLVGDVNQLPPVGHGAPLRDLIKAGLPYGELTEIKRNSGGIVEACAAIRDGKPWECGDNLILISATKPDSQVEQLKILLKKLEREGFDPVWDCQTLVAVNEKSTLSRKAINEVLQNELNHNPRPATKNKSELRLGDKVVNLQNNRFRDVEDRDEQHYVANGDIGEVVFVDEKSYHVELKTPTRRIVVPRGQAKGDESGCTFDLAYGLSCHKSQGSEFPVAIVMLDDSPGGKMVCSKEWAYTAISRAKQRCYLIGKKSTADAMCRKQVIDKRKTFLRERILLNVSNLEMMEI